MAQIKKPKNDEEVQILQKKLNSGTKMIDVTFKSLDLEVLGFGFCGINDNGWLQLMIEIGSAEGKKLKGDVAIKINCYDDENTIIFSTEEILYKSDFNVYDTRKIYLIEKNLAFRMDKCRVFATKH